jgi:hypothetical protein
MKDYEFAAHEAARGNPDGWAVDPEAVLATQEYLWETAEFNGGPEAALEAARKSWKFHMTKFRALGALLQAPQSPTPHPAPPLDLVVLARGEHAGMLVELEKMGAQWAAKAKDGGR